MDHLLLLVRSAPDDPGVAESLLYRSDGQVWAQWETLDRWRVPLPREFHYEDGIRWYPLRRIKGLRYRYDACTQELWLDSGRVNRPRRRYDLLSPPAGQAAHVEPGGYFNFDAQYDHASGAASVSGLGELGFFNRWGYGGTTLLAGRERAVRLDTSWTVDEPEALRRLTLGDGISRASQFGLPLRMGGVQWGRVFALRPDVVTYPLPSLRGNAVLPSSVDVYVNQMQRAHQDVPAGPFELAQVPVVAGQGTVQLVVRDMLGREQVIAYPFYTAPSLLREGLTDYTVEAGSQRNNYGLNSADYGPVFAAGTYRAGVTRSLTAEAHGEMMAARQMASVAAAWLYPAAGVFTVGVAGSRAAGAIGSSYLVGYERVADQWSIGGELRRAGPSFARIGEGSNALRRSDLARLSFIAAPGVTLSLNFLRQQRDQLGVSTIAGAGVSVHAFRDWYVNLSGNRVETADARNSLMFLALSHPFGGNLYGSAQIMSSDGGSPQERIGVQRNMGGELGYAWQAALEEGGYGRRDGHFQLSRDFGRLRADVEQSSLGEAYRMGYAAGIAWLGRDTFWTRPVQGSFAVVETGGVPGVRVYADERLAGRSDATGKMLVPNVRPYETFRLRIEEADVPMGYQLGGIRQSMFLPTRGAVRMAFPVSRDTGLLVRLRLASRKPVPVGATISIDGRDNPLPVGFDGKVYLQDAGGSRRLQASWNGHRCRAAWTAKAARRQPLNLLCKEVAP